MAARGWKFDGLHEKRQCLGVTDGKNAGEKLGFGMKREVILLEDKKK